MNLFRKFSGPFTHTWYAFLGHTICRVRGHNESTFDVVADDDWKKVTGQLVWCQRCYDILRTSDDD